MSGQPEVLLKVRQWVEKAEHDFTAAEYMLTMPKGCPFDTVCFHAQQCAEKYLKGFLAFRSVDFPKTHDLVVLLNLAGGPETFGVDLLDIEPLNRYPVEARYPGDWESFAREEAEEAVRLARKVRRAVRKHLPAPP
ncbi:MAG: hypothetical protein A3G87_01660 [Omnitrophica bacterium RIFCSPLOWO2_12_FULL_50_11]|nr:MAG: hypothetical protein A3G87_01660 [Omnitrophica bacterium RIFCSPLOWO2_12_FULL_50_11]